MYAGRVLKYASKSIHLTPSKKTPVYINKTIRDISNSHQIQQHDLNKSLFNAFINLISNQNFSQALNDLPLYTHHFSPLHYSSFHCLLLLLTHSYGSMPALINSDLMNTGHNLHSLEITIQVKRMISYLILPIAKVAEESLISLSIPQIESFSDINSIQTIFSLSHSIIVYTLIICLLNINKNDKTKLKEFLLNQIALSICSDCALCTFIKKIIKKISGSVKSTKRLINPKLTIRIKNNCLNAKKLMQECQITKLKTENNFSSFQKYIENATNNNNHSYNHHQINKVKYSWNSNSKNSFINCSRISNDRKKLMGYNYTYNYNNTSTQDKSYDMYKVIKPKEIHYKRKERTKLKLDSTTASSSQSYHDSIDKHISSIQKQLLFLENSIKQFKADTEYIQAQLTLTLTN